MQQNIKLSVVIPAHNEEKNISKTIKNLKKHLISLSKDVSHEIIVVCDACDDDTADVSRKAGATRILNVNNKKVSITRNDGADIAEGEYLLFLDADTLLERGVNAISGSIKILEENADVSIVGSYWNNDVVTDNPSGSSIYKFLTNWFLYLTNTCGGYYLMCRKEGFIPFRDDVKNEDIDWCENMKANTNGVCHLLKDGVITSMRRLEKKGLIPTVWFYMSKEVCFMFFKILLKIIILILIIFVIIYMIKKYKN